MIKGFVKMAGGLSSWMSRGRSICVCRTGLWKTRQKWFSPPAALPDVPRSQRERKRVAIRLCSIQTGFHTSELSGRGERGDGVHVDFWEHRLEDNY